MTPPSNDDVIPNFATEADQPVAKQPIPDQPVPWCKPVAQCSLAALSGWRGYSQSYLLEFRVVRSCT